MHVLPSVSAEDDASEDLGERRTFDSPRTVADLLLISPDGQLLKNPAAERRRQAAMMNSFNSKEQKPYPVDTVVTSNAWRRFGESRRQELLVKDRMEGGTSFQINGLCAIQRYFLLAERVMAQFRSMYLNRSKLETSYVMGHRLIVFFSEALPQHPGYLSQDPEITALREKVLRELSWIEHQVDRLALQIDEEQLNEFILNDLDPAPANMDEDDDTSSSSSSSASPDIRDKRRNGYDWENFAQWSFDIDTRNEKKIIHEVSLDGNDLTDTSSSTTSTMEELVVTEADTDEEDAKPVNTCVTTTRYALVETEVDTSFLEKIANEEVKYETDSEAVDSWAQDSDSAVLSGGSGPAISCDPARFALAEIMNSSRYNTARGRMCAPEEPSQKKSRHRVTWNLPEESTTEEPAPEPVPNPTQAYGSRRTSKLSTRGQEIVNAFPEDFDGDGWVSFDDDSVGSFRFSS